MAKENAKPAEVARELPRERIVACAQELFHRHGIRGVGVETIAEAAGTNKMTLYRHFGSKDDLVLEYLSRKGRKAEEIWADIEAASPGRSCRPALWLCRSGREIHRRG
jgi:AcrR family transcriptional regulator